MDRAELEINELKIIDELIKDHLVKNIYNPDAQKFLDIRNKLAVIIYNDKPSVLKIDQKEDVVAMINSRLLDLMEIKKKLLGV